MENEILEIKLYTPLTAEFCPTDDEYDWEDRVEDEAVEALSGYELLQYEDSIAKEIAKENSGDWDGNLMAYYDKKDALKAKVISAVISVAPHENQLCGCATVQLKQPLEGNELNTLMKYLAGQYSDGFGEGFEQREIKVDGGVLYVHLWQSNDFHFQQALPSAQKPLRPAMKLAGQDGNIYAILGRASRLLRRSGMEAQAKEMADRVFHSGSYVQALNIVSEYVQTELSEPHTPKADPKNKDVSR